MALWIAPASFSDVLGGAFSRTGNECVWIVTGACLRAQFTLLRLQPCRYVWCFIVLIIAAIVFIVVWKTEHPSADNVNTVPLPCARPPCH